MCVPLAVRYVCELLISSFTLVNLLTGDARLFWTLRVLLCTFAAVQTVPPSPLSVLCIICYVPSYRSLRTTQNCRTVETSFSARTQLRHYSPRPNPFPPPPPPIARRSIPQTILYPRTPAVYCLKTSIVDHAIHNRVALTPAKRGWTLRLKPSAHLK